MPPNREEFDAQAGLRTKSYLVELGSETIPWVSLSSAVSWLVGRKSSHRALMVFKFRTLEGRLRGIEMKRC